MALATHNAPGPLTTLEVQPPRKPVPHWRSTQQEYERAVAMISSQPDEHHSCTAILLKVSGTHAVLCASSIVSSPAVARRVTADFFANGSGVPAIKARLLPSRLFERLSVGKLTLVAVDEAPLREAQIVPQRPWAPAVLRAALREAGDDYPPQADGAFDELTRGLDEEELTALCLVTHDCAATKSRQELKLRRVFVSTADAPEAGGAKHAQPAAAQPAAQQPPSSVMKLLGGADPSRPAPARTGTPEPQLSLAMALQMKRASRKLRKAKELRRRNEDESAFVRSLIGVEMIELEQEVSLDGSHGAPIFWQGRWVGCVMNAGRPGVRMRIVAAAEPLLRSAAAKIAKHVADGGSASLPLDPENEQEAHPVEGAPFVTYNHFRHHDFRRTAPPAYDEHGNRIKGLRLSLLPEIDSSAGVSSMLMYDAVRRDHPAPNALEAAASTVPAVRGLEPNMRQLLAKATQEGNFETLAAHPPEVLAFRTADGRTLAHIAAMADAQESLLALRDFGVDLGAPTRFGDTPAHVAAYQGHVGILRLLLDNGIDLTQSNDRGERPIDKAALQQRVAVLDWFGERGLGQAPEPPTWNLPVDKDPF